MRVKQAEIDEARESLARMLKPGDTVYTVLRSVSRSGMSRQIGILVPSGTGEFFYPNYSASILLGEPMNKAGDGVKVGGCGMDMGYHVVYSLGRALYPEGFGCSGKGCPSNDHSNGDRDYTPHEDHPQVCKDNPGTCTGAKHWHSDGGYAFRHRWI